jgi:hypothetical protein
MAALSTSQPSLRRPLTVPPPSGGGECIASRLSRDKTSERGGVMRHQIGDIVVHVGEGTGVWHALFAQ